MCFLYLRNVKGHRWNHKRVYRIYRELELNLRIKPRNRIVREKPEPLAVPEAIIQCWSMAFMHDQLADGCSFRLFNLIDDLTVKPWPWISICNFRQNASCTHWIRSSSGTGSHRLFAATMARSTSAAS